MEAIEDPAELAQVRQQARAIQIKAVLAAIPLTLIALILPNRHAPRRGRMVKLV